MNARQFAWTRHNNRPRHVAAVDRYESATKDAWRSSLARFEFACSAIRQARAAWAAVCPLELLTSASVDSFTDGTLTIAVKGSSVIARLSPRATRLATELRSRVPGLRQLRFRVTPLDAREARPDQSPERKRRAQEPTP